MPRVLQHNLPPAVLRHLIARINDREIAVADLQHLNDWLNTHPEVPHGRWFKRFPDMTVCGEGELVKTFLLPHQAATGEEVI